MRSRLFSHPRLSEAAPAHVPPLRFLAHGAVEALWPTRCAGCDLPGGLLCPSCTAALPAIDLARACPRCGAPFGALVCTECTPYRDDPDGACDGPSVRQACDPSDRNGRVRAACEPFDRLEAVGCYGVHAWPLDRLVRAYKDAGERRAASLLASMLVRVASGRSWPCGFDAVAFVPCTPAAFARRGLDHMEPVAREVACMLGVPLADVLARSRTRDQRGLSRAARRANARWSTVALGRLDGSRILLLDDVVTTGATLSSAADALRAAGCRSVVAAAVARAW